MIQFVIIIIALLVISVLVNIFLIDSNKDLKKDNDKLLDRCKGYIDQINNNADYANQDDELQHKQDIIKDNIKDQGEDEKKETNSNVTYIFNDSEL